MYILCIYGVYGVYIYIYIAGQNPTQPLAQERLRGQRLGEPRLHALRCYLSGSHHLHPSRRLSRALERPNGTALEMLEIYMIDYYNTYIYICILVYTGTGASWVSSMGVYPLTSTGDSNIDQLLFHCMVFKSFHDCKFPNGWF